MAMFEVFFGVAAGSGTTYKICGRDDEAPCVRIDVAVTDSASFFE
jgi:K+-sensing histidine kinase KdpD